MRCAVSMCSRTPDACPVVWVDRAIKGHIQVQIPLAFCVVHVLEFDVFEDFVLVPELRRAAELELEKKEIQDVDWRSARLVQWAQLVGSDHDLKRKHDNLLVEENENPNEDDPLEEGAVSGIQGLEGGEDETG